MNRRIGILFLVLVLSAVPVVGETADREPALFGVGFQRITWNCWGISLMVNLTPRLSVEGLVGLLGDRQAYGLRVLARPFHRRAYNAYLYGLLGTETVEEWGIKETGLLVGTGAGFEYNFPRVIADLISIGLHAEMGVEFLSGYVVIDANYTSFTYSAGFHLRI